MEAFVVAPLIMLAVFFVGGSILWARWVEKNRRNKLSEVAELLGLEYRPAGTGLLQGRLGGFALFNHGTDRRLTNVIEGDSGDVVIAIFDYQFTIGSGKQRSTERQSVIALSSPHLNCPQLALRPQRMLDWIGSVIGFQNIKFETHPTFSRLFVVQGPDEDAIRSFMSPDLLTFFESRQGYTLEASGNSMLFYRSKRRLKPDQIKDGLSEAYEIYHLLVAK